MMLEYGALFAGSCLLALLIGYPVRMLALSLDVVDRPEKRKMHPIPVPLMGGLAIYLAFVAVSLAQFLIRNPLQDGPLSAYLGLLAGATIVLLLGIYDDVAGLKPVAKFAGQTAAALVVVAAGARIDWFTNPLGDSVHIGWAGIPVAVLWIVGVTNAVNLIDGLDGLAAGIGAIASLGIFALAASQNPFVAGTAIILAGAILGFLKHNFYPARLFLGDTGSMLIGFLLAVIGLNGSLKATTATMLFLPIIVLGVPILDTFFAIFRRARRRVSPFKADREHIHHRLVRIGLHHRNVVLVMYFVCAYLAITAYSIAQFPYQTALLFVVLLMMGGIIGLRTIQFIEERLEQLRPGADAATRDGRGGRPAGITNGHTLNGSAHRGAEFGSLVAEVGGFGDGLREGADLQALCADITSILKRRIKVYAVVAEPLAPGRILLVLRTGPLKPSLAALVKDGVAWYLDEHREKFAGSGEFPAIHWIGTVAAPRDAGTAPAGGGQQGATVPLEPVPIREGRAGWARS